MDQLSSNQEQLLRELRETDLLISYATDNSDPEYPRTLFWNHGIDHHPLAIVVPQSATEVQLALELAGKHDVPVGIVNAGGHDSRGRAISLGTLCLDLSKHFRNVVFDQNKMEVRVGGGCNFEDVLPRLPEGFEISTGTIKSVGISGFHTGGGFGYITHVVGAGVDQLRGATVVLADGRIVECSDTQHENLQWCLRGGGGGFGVILELRITVHELPKMLHASITWPLEEREAVQEAFKTYQDLVEAYPDQLSVFVRISTIPGVGPVVGLVPTFHGPQDVAERVFDRLASISHAKVLLRDWRHYKDMLDHLAEKAAPKGGYYHSSTQSFTRIPPSAVDILIDANLADPHGKAIIHDIHGVACQREVKDTAFPLRTPHSTIFIVGAYGLRDEKPTEELSQQTKRWAEDLSKSLGMQPGALPGGHPSLLRPEETDKVEKWFGPNAEKSKWMRGRLDPEGRFNGAIGYMSPDPNSYVSQNGSVVV